MFLLPHWGSRIILRDVTQLLSAELGKGKSKFIHLRFFRINIRLYQEKPFRLQTRETIFESEGTLFSQHSEPFHEDPTYPALDYFKILSEVFDFEKVDRIFKNKTKSRIFYFNFIPFVIF